MIASTRPSPLELSSSLLPRLVFDFSLWDALACYLRDPAGGVVDWVAAHRGLDESGGGSKKKGAALVGLSEVRVSWETSGKWPSTLKKQVLGVWSGSLDDPDGVGLRR